MLLLKNILVLGFVVGLSFGAFAFEKGDVVFKKCGDFKGHKIQVSINGIGVFKSLLTVAGKDYELDDCMVGGMGQPMHDITNISCTVEPSASESGADKKPTVEMFGEDGILNTVTYQLPGESQKTLFYCYP